MKFRIQNPRDRAALLVHANMCYLHVDVPEDVALYYYELILSGAKTYRKIDEFDEALINELEYIYTAFDEFDIFLEDIRKSLHRLIRTVKRRLGI